MTIGLVILMSLVLVVSFLIVLARTFGLGRVLKHAGKVDVLFTIIACILLAGSVTGLLIGILSGLFMTVALTIMEWLRKATSMAVPRPVWPKAKVAAEPAYKHPYDDGYEPVGGW